MLHEVTAQKYLLNIIIEEESYLKDLKQKER